MNEKEIKKIIRKVFLSKTEEEKAQSMKEIEKFKKEIEEADKEIESEDKKLSPQEKKERDRIIKSMVRRIEAESIDPSLEEVVESLKASLSRAAKLEADRQKEPGSMVKIFTYRMSDLQKYPEKLEEEKRFRKEMEPFLRKLEEKYGHPKGTFKIVEEDRAL